MRRARLEAILPYLLAASFAVAMLLFFPFRFKFEFNPDEGIQLIKAFLYARGHALQTEIFSDQPPLFTLVLAGLFRLLGPKVLVARLAVLAFSCLLLTTSLSFVKRSHGILASVLAFVLLTTLPLYPQLSVSAMIGLPALSLAMASLAALGQWHHSRAAGWLTLSAVVFSLSLFTKAFTLVLIPVFILGILLSDPAERNLRGWVARNWKPAAAWLFVAGGLLLVLLLVTIGPRAWDQLVVVHASALGVEIEGVQASTLLKATWPVLVLALAGAGVSLRRRSWAGLLLAGWFVTGLAVILINRPAWWHQHILATLPGAMLAAIAIAACIDALRGPAVERRPLRWGRLVAAGGLILAAGYLAARLPGHLDGFKPRLPNLIDDIELKAREYNVLAAIEKYDPGGAVIITDRPMFAFRSEREIPPELAVFSDKRLSTGWLTEDQVIAAIETVQPQIVLLARFSLPRVREYVQDRYELVYSYYPFRLFRRAE
jgi:hypothetical protein